MKKGLTDICYGFFSTLANPTRLAIIELLNERPMNVSEIVESLNQEQSMISHNLRPLTRCKLVKRRREGKNNVYYLNHETIDPILNAVENHADKYCAGGENCPLKKKQSKE
jgi:ArsR family transcriptional regulator, zinc-responsive transcriptional repressor